MHPPYIFCLKTAKGHQFSPCFHFQDLKQHGVFIYFDWFPNSPELGNPSKSCSGLRCWRSSVRPHFSIRTSQLKNKPGEVKWQTCFLEQNMSVRKNGEKTTPLLHLWVVQLIVFQNENSSSTMPVAGDLGLLGTDQRKITNFPLRYLKGKTGNTRLTC